MATAAEMVTEIDTAILALVRGSIAEYETEGVKYKKTDLDSLRLLRREYARIAGTAAGTGSRIKLVELRQDT